MKKIETVIVLGSGALKIGEAGEFDYSGTQAIKALKEEGIRVVLVNPNIATIQTSSGLADSVYFVPVTVHFVARVIEAEKPDGILLSFGGQTALNCGIALYREGILKKYKVEILGTPIDAILATEDRHVFADRLSRLGLATAKGYTVTSIEAGLVAADKITYPVMVRAGFALGGMGSGIAKNALHLQSILEHAFAVSSQVQIEECLWGWKEIEYEVVRDRDDNCITVCNMENFDPVGIHTGESIVVAPSQTLTDDEYYRLRQHSIDVIRNLGIVGECNIQFALHPKSNELRVIEVNARLSRSSALASKATGYPLAYVAAKLALGATLPSLTNAVTGQTSAYFEPSLDYVVVKIPRWDLDKFTGVKIEIGSEMKSVGEVMSIGRSLPEAIQKAARMLNDGYSGVLDPRYAVESKKVLLKRLTSPNSMRLLTICSALRAGVPVSTIAKKTGIDTFFLEQLMRIVRTYKAIARAKTLDHALLLSAKRDGFSDEQIALLRKTTQKTVRADRIKKGIVPSVKRIDTMAGEFPAKTNYLYMTYHGDSSDHAPVTRKKRIAVIGAGPYAIGTSVEFDWCAVNTVKALRASGVDTVMINCNPETVSTDYDYSDVLYFEELTLERLLDIYEIEKAPFVCSVGGQIPNNVAPLLASYGVPILGTKPKDIERAEDRRLFSALLDELHIAQPRWAKVHSISQALAAATRVGYPILLRPSFVLSGRAMKTVSSEEELRDYLTRNIKISSSYPLVMTHYMTRALECDVDGVARDGVIVAKAISEHVEPAGIHSGDSTLQLPGISIRKSIKEDIVDMTSRIVKKLNIHGPFNIQFLVHEDTPYVIECNARASRSMPFVSKTTGTNYIEVATKVMLGEPIVKTNGIHLPFVGVKAPQFSFHKLRGADPVLEVEMRSTGEVASFGLDPYEAYLKAILSTGIAYPTKKAVLVSLGGSSQKLTFLYGCQKLSILGFTIYATEGTALFLQENNIAVTRVEKISDRPPNVMELFEQKKIDFAVVVPREGRPGQINGAHKDSEGYQMRRAATDAGIPIFTSTQTATYFVLSFSRFTLDTVPVEPLEWYQSLQKKG